MTLIFAVALIAIVLIVVIYAAGVIWLGWHAWLATDSPNRFSENVYGFTDAEIALAEQERIRELEKPVRIARRCYCLDPKCPDFARPTEWIS